MVHSYMYGLSCDRVSGEEEVPVALEHRSSHERGHVDHPDEFNYWFTTGARRPLGQVACTEQIWRGSADVLRADERARPISQWFPIQWRGREDEWAMDRLALDQNIEKVAPCLHCLERSDRIVD